MASFGKKILGAFVETAEARAKAVGSNSGEFATISGGDGGSGGDRGSGGDGGSGALAGGVTEDRFAGHFDKLLSEANIPGPDYYEFARMIAVMRGISDEAARFNAAFAGLQVQGLDKQRLLETAAEYLRVLTADAQQFQTTVDASYQEKVKGKESEAKGMAARIQSLSQEMLQLQQRIGVLQEEIRTSKEKLVGGSSAYAAESKRRQLEIQRDVEKINQYIH